MNVPEPDAYCFFQDIAPRDPLVARFDRDYLLHAVTGALKVDVEGRRWVLPPSFAAWVPAGTEMTVTLDRPVTSCSILVRPGMDHGMPNTPEAFQMTRMTRDMAWHCRDWGKNAAHTSQAAVFFAALLSTCATLIQSSINVARPSSDDPGLKRAIAYTEAHFEADLTAAQVAAAVGLSARTMQRRFSQDVGMSWGQALVQIRMIHALELLALPKTPIIHIAMACGYRSVSAFNRTFKSYSGLTPTAFRDRLS